MQNCLLLVVLWLLSGAAWSNSASPQKLSQVIGHSVLLSASALAYFNPHERLRDERNLTSAYSSLYSLEMSMAHLEPLAAQVQPLEQMKSLLAMLEALPEQQHERYPELLLLLLREQQVLSQAAANAYAQQRDSSAGLERLLSEQSHDVASLLLDYQIRHYPEIAASSKVLLAAELEALIASVDQRFNRLLAEQPEHAEALGKINTQYRFSRGQVLNLGGRLQTGVQFYLSRVIVDLQALAVETNAD